MALEKTLLAVNPVLFTANGTSLGVVTVSDTVNFLDKQFVYLKSDTIPETQYQIKQVLSSTQLVVGPVGGVLTITNYSDISNFLVSDNAMIGAPAQSKNVRPPEPDHYWGIYQSSPTNADRTILVDPYGDLISNQNPLPIAFDGTVNIGDVSILDPVTHTAMKVNADGSINVTDAITHTDLTQIDTDLLAFKSANHTDLTQIDTDLLAFKSANHVDLNTLNTTLTSFENSNHTDLTTFASQNHTDLTQIDTDIKAIEGPVTPGPVASKSALIGGQYNSTFPKLTSGQQVALQTDAQGKIIANSRQPPGTLDVFGTTTSAPRQLQIDIQFFNGILSSLVNLSTSGSGSGFMGSGNALFTTGTSASGQCSGVSTETTSYAAGCEIFAHFTAAFTIPTSASSYQRIGLFNSLNGFYVGYNGTSFVVAVRNNGTDTTYSQTNWNLDTLTAQAGSLFTRNGIPEAINLTYANVWRVRFGWLGSAPIYFEVLAPDGEWVTFHKVLQPNSSVNPSITNPNLPITVDVYKNAADATNLTIYTACWGAGITFATNILEDPQTFEYINIDPRNELRTSSSIMLVGGVQTGSILDTNLWNTTTSGSGSYTISGGLNQLTTNTTANSSIMMNSISRARFIPGTINAFYAGIRLPDTGIINNIRRWGAFGTNNGVFFELNGISPTIGVRNNGVDTLITNFNGPYAYVLDTNFHTYEIQYSSGSALYYQDGKLIHKYTSSTTALSASPHYVLGFENTNINGSTTNTSLYIRGSAILRYGEANARPRYFHPVYTSRIQSVGTATSGGGTSLTANITSTKAGNLLVIAATAINNTLTITDNKSQIYSTATSSTNGSSNLYIFYVQNTVAGVNSITITSPTNSQLSLIVNEYSNINTSSALDQVSNFYNAGATSWTSNSTPSTTQINELLIGAASDIQHNNTNFVAGTNWSSVTTTHSSGGGGNVSGFFEEQYVSSTGTYAATGTSSQTANILAAIATFKIINNSLSSGFTIPNTPTLITIGAGTFRRVIINTLGSTGSTVTFYDNTTNSGNIIAVLSLSSQIGYFDYDLDFSNGLTMVVNTNSGDFTIVYD